jgi:uncharacterized membrane protein
MADTTPTPVTPIAPVQPVVEPTEPKLAVEQDEKFFAALAYVFIMFVVTLVAKPKSKYCKFHARQSMVLFLTSIVVLFVLAAIPWIGSLLTLGLFAVYILAIYRAYMGEMWNIPVVSTFAGKMDLDSLYGKAGLAVSTVSNLKEKAEGMATKATDAVKAAGKQEEEKKPDEPAKG